MTRAITPTPAEIADALAVAVMGGELARLSAICTAQAAGAPEPGRTRLRRAAAALAFAAGMTGDQLAHADAEISHSDRTGR